MTTAVRRRSLLSGTLALTATQVACSSESSAPRGAPQRPSPQAASRMRGCRPPPATVFGSCSPTSPAGENHNYGDRIDLEAGNTEVLALLISRRVRELGVAHDVHEIEAPLASINGYDTVLLASPIWHVRPPMVMHTFADSYDWTGKTIHPVTTYAMSGLGTAEREYADACAGAPIGEGLAVQGEKVRADGPSAVADWLDRINLTRTGPT